MMSRSQPLLSDPHSEGEREWVRFYYHHPSIHPGNIQLWVEFRGTFVWRVVGPPLCVYRSSGRMEFYSILHYYALQVGDCLSAAACCCWLNVAYLFVITSYQKPTEFTLNLTHCDRKWVNCLSILGETIRLELVGKQLVGERPLVGGILLIQTTITDTCLPKIPQHQPWKTLPTQSVIYL